MDHTEKIYRNRITDSALEVKLEAFGATLIVGPKGCGKTTTKTKKRSPNKLFILRGKNAKIRITVNSHS